MHVRNIFVTSHPLIRSALRLLCGHVNGNAAAHPKDLTQESQLQPLTALAISMICVLSSLPVFSNSISLD